MKKLLFLFLSFLFFFCNAETLKAGIEESYIPAGFYGSWGVISKLNNCTNPDIFNYESRDIWILSGYGNVLILENIESGARSEITIKEKATDGKTLKFERQKTVNTQDNKIIYRETVTFVLSGNNFSGSDRFVIEKYTPQGALLKKDSADYRVEGVKIAGENPK
ncbi:MAG: hypothetical protein IKR34_05135 [Candidatus Gastranaerophilales bacterium]|nr:hypothetical protein [Candidatus Gastranaerophilales bacterium]